MLVDDLSQARERGRASGVAGGHHGLPLFLVSNFVCAGVVDGLVVRVILRGESYADSVKYDTAEDVCKALGALRAEIADVRSRQCVPPGRQPDASAGAGMRDGCVRLVLAV